MGHQLWAGKEDLSFTRGAWLVVHWCEQITPRTKPEGMTDWEWADTLAGSTDIPINAVLAADRAVPMEFETAKRAGFCERDVTGWSPDVDSFDQCRAFLRYAAENNLSISSSW